MLGRFRDAVESMRDREGLHCGALLPEEDILDAFGPARWKWQGWIYRVHPLFGGRPGVQLLVVDRGRGEVEGNRSAQENALLGLISFQRGLGVPTKPRRAS